MLYRVFDNKVTESDPLPMFGISWQSTSQAIEFIHEADGGSLAIDVMDEEAWDSSLVLRKINYTF